MTHYLKPFFVSLLVLISLTFLGSSCSDDVKEFYGNPHNLREVTSLQTNSSSFGGAFFFLAGGISGQSHTSITVYYSWQDSTGVFINASVPWESVRRKLDPNCITPTVQFVWNRVSRNDAHQYTVRTGEVLFTCRPDQWPVSVDMSLRPTN